MNIGWLVHPNLHPLLARGTATFLIAVGAAIFAESGLLVGFFLPGDSLLFSAGLVAALGGRPNILLLIAIVFVAAALGDQVGFVVGAKLGSSLFTRPNSRFFKQDNVTRTRAFFDRHGAKAVVLARFVPVVRTFTPVLAGVSRMHYRTFVTFNIIGAALWAALATSLGYGLGKRFPSLENYLTPILVVVVAVSLLPVALEVARSRRAPTLP